MAPPSGKSYFAVDRLVAIEIERLGNEHPDHLKGAMAAVVETAGQSGRTGLWPVFLDTKKRDHPRG
jgi:hypothetical protein